mgnify:CR=1 FL=1
MSNSILEMRSITKTFPGVVALDKVTLTVERGEIHAICGENGAGKSTLMKVLSGVYPFGSYSGDIVFENNVKKFSNIRDSEAEGIVIIHQELALSPHLSIAENIFLNNEIKRFGLIDWNKTGQEAQMLMARVGLKENPDAKIKDIGVGKQQLVEIAKALSQDAKILGFHQHRRRGAADPRHRGCLGRTARPRPVARLARRARNVGAGFFRA